MLEYFYEHSHNDNAIGLHAVFMASDPTEGDGRNVRLYRFKEGS